MIKLKSEKPEEQIRKSMNGIFEQTKLLSMATIREVDGEIKSWINNAFFAYTDDLKLYVLTGPESVHGKNLQQNQSVAVTVIDTTQQPGGKRQGMQLVGKGWRITDENEESAALKKWFDRMMGGADFEGFEKKYRTIFESKMHVLVIDYVKIFDEKTFGEEVWIEAKVLR